MADWQTVPMRELCSIQSGKSDTKDAVADGPYAFFDRSKSIKRSSRFLRDCEALIIPGEGAVFLPRHFVGKFDLHQRAYALFNFSSRLRGPCNSGCALNSRSRPRTGDPRAEELSNSTTALKLPQA